MPAYIWPTSCTWIGMLKKWSMRYMPPAVKIRPCSSQQGAPQRLWQWALGNGQLGPALHPPPAPADACSIPGRVCMRACALQMWFWGSARFAWCCMEYRPRPQAGPRPKGYAPPPLPPPPPGPPRTGYTVPPTTRPSGYHVRSSNLRAAGDSAACKGGGTASWNAGCCRCAPLPCGWGWRPPPPRRWCALYPRRPYQFHIS